MKNHNLWVALRAAFPNDLDETAIETADAPASLRYSCLLYTSRCV